MAFNDRASEINSPRGVMGVRLADRPHLLPREAEYVLGYGAGQVRTLLREGVLVNASPDRWIRIDVGSLEKFVREEVARGHLSPSTLGVLEDLVQRRLHISKVGRCVSNTATSDLGLEEG
jgi:hypothetical protein